MMGGVPLIQSFEVTITSFMKLTNFGFQTGSFWVFWWTPDRMVGTIAASHPHYVALVQTFIP